MFWDLLFEDWWPDAPLTIVSGLLAYFVAYVGTSLARGQLRKYHYGIQHDLIERYGLGVLPDEVRRIYFADEKGERGIFGLTSNR